MTQLQRCDQLLEGCFAEGVLRDSKIADLKLTRSRINLEKGDWNTVSQQLHQLEENETEKKYIIAIKRAKSRLYSA